MPPTGSAHAEQDPPGDDPESAPARRGPAPRPPWPVAALDMTVAEPADFTDRGLQAQGGPEPTTWTGGLPERLRPQLRAGGRGPSSQPLQAPASAYLQVSPSGDVGTAGAVAGGRGLPPWRFRALALAHLQASPPGDQVTWALQDPRAGGRGSRLWAPKGR